MNPNQNTSGGITDLERQLAFSQELQVLSNLIHSTHNLDEIMLDLAEDICKLFACERLTLYAISRERNVLYSRVKTGINSNKDLVLPLSCDSIAGFVALKQQVVNIGNVYDALQLSLISPELRFFAKVDQALGFETRQMLAAPIIDRDGQLLGVIQLLNTCNELPFGMQAQQGLQQLCSTLAVAFAQRIGQVLGPGACYRPLVDDGLISLGDLELLVRWATRKGLVLEDLLRSEYQISLAAIGKAVARHFQVTYEPFIPNRNIPYKLRTKLNREKVLQQQWLPIAEERAGLTVLTTDPIQANSDGLIQKAFAYPGIFFRVTTRQEFLQTVDTLFPA